MSAKPAYIFRDGGMMFAPPFLQADTFLSGWLVPSDKAAQQALLDRTVNAARPGSTLRYEAVMPRLMLSFADIKRVTSLDPEQKDYGYVTEKDVTVWFLAAAREGDTIKRMVWFLPYIWVDNPLAVVVGREVFGFPKHLAQMSIPSRAADPGPFSVDAPVLAHYGRELRADPARLIDLRPSGLESVPPPAPTRELALEDLPGYFADATSSSGSVPQEEGMFASAGNLMKQLVSDLQRKTLPILFLKQFPDATLPGHACYQRVIEAPARITSLDKIGLMPGSWSAQFHSHASHRLHETLGVKTGSIEVGRGVCLQYSFAMEMGVEIT